MSYRTTRNSNCPYCSGLKTIIGENDLATTNPELIKEWDYSKNDKKGIKPEIVKAGSNLKVWWKCSKGHEWEVPIINRAIRKMGCPYCSNRRIIIGYNDLKTTNPKLIEEWDYEKNKNIKPTEITAGSGIKVWWKCKKCGHEWEANPNHRTRGRGCPACKLNGKKVRK